jgi:hypothetical protein
MSVSDPATIDSGNFLVRLGMTIVYLIILSVIRFVLWAVLLVQILCHLFSGHASRQAQRLGQSVSQYIYRIWLYLTYSSNERPFPFSGRKRQGQT